MHKGRASGKRAPGVRRKTHLRTSALLEFLAPPPGWELDRALCSTYSAHCSVLIAMLLAMSGHTNGETASAVSVAKALTRLKGKVSILLQSGRLAAPRNRQTILALLDRFVVPVNWDERDAGCSWHPKICVLRFRQSESGKGRQRASEKSLWRIWIGSRNFTTDNSWDMALSLTSSDTTGTGQCIPGIDGLVKTLATLSSQTAAWERHLSSLRRVKWAVPEGITVESIRLFLPSDKGRDFPVAPSDTSHVLAVSPFIDARGVRYLASQTVSGERVLVSLEEQIASACGRQGSPALRLQCLPPPSDSDVDQDLEADALADEEPEPRGLHAKFLWFRSRDKAKLYLGSCNLTQRGYARNAEVQAVLDVQSPKASKAAMLLHNGIEQFEAMCELYEATDHEIDEHAQKVERALERMRKTLAHKFCGGQKLLPDTSCSVSAAFPVSLPQDMTLYVGRIGELGTPWPGGQSQTVLPVSRIEENSDLLQFRLEFESATVSWLQHVPFDPPLSEDKRDVPLLHAYLGASGFLLWLSDLFSVSGVSGGQRRLWNERDTRRPEPVDPLGISVESVLAAWIRDPEAINRVKAVIGMTVGLLDDTSVTDDIRVQLRNLLSAWHTIEPVLGRRRLT